MLQKTLLTFLLAAPLAVLAMAPASAQSQAPALPRLSAYIAEHCDWQQANWCELRTENSFDDVRWKDDIAGAKQGLDSLRIFRSYSGAAFDGAAMYFFGGGHKGYAGNEVYKLDLETLRWERLSAPDPIDDGGKFMLDNFDYADCPTPSRHGVYAGHTYSTPLVYRGRLHVWPTFGKCDKRQSAPGPVFSTFDLSTNDWAPMIKPPGITGQGVSAATLSPVDGRALLIESRSSSHIREVDLATGKIVRSSRFGRFVGFGNAVTVGNTAIFYHNRMVSLQVPEPGSALASPVVKEAPKKLIPPHSGMDYHPGSNSLVFWTGRGREVYLISVESVTDPARQLAVTRVPNEKGPTPRPGHLVYSKWRYLPQADLFIGVNKGDTDPWLYRLPEKIPDLRAELQAQGFECADGVPGWGCPDINKLLAKGGEVTLRKGVYLQCANIKKPTVINGNGAHFKNVACNGKGAFVGKADLVLRDLECSGIQVPDGNGACVRQQAGQLTLENVHFHDSQQGVLANTGVQDVTVVDSVFERLGGDCKRPHTCGRAHGIYFGGTQGQFRLVNTQLRAARDEGHLLKVGVGRIEIVGSIFDERGGNGSRAIDAYNGGELIIRNSRFFGQPNDGNRQIIGYNAEGRVRHQRNRIEIENSEFDCAGGLLTSRGAPEPQMIGSNSIKRC
mgnify:CR=1 FL=1